LVAYSASDFAGPAKRLSWNGKIVYRARVRLKSHPPQTSQFSTLAQARQRGKQTEAAILEGRYFPKVEAQRHTVKELIERYQREVLPHKRASTIPTQRLQLQWWQQEIGAYTLADITPVLLVTYRNTLAEDHANATVNRYFEQLRRNLSRKDFVPLRGTMGYPVIFVVVFPGDHHYADP